MNNDEISAYTAFEGEKLLFRGSLEDVVLKIKRRIGRDENSAILIFSDATGQSLDFNFQGTEADVLKRLNVFISATDGKERVGPGRPKLGVMSREVSLLPRHWEWLATQSGGASAALRRLVEGAKKKTGEGGGVKSAQERAYKFMSAMAGDLAGYEEALRALYKKDHERFADQIKNWPRDVRLHAVRLAKPVFGGS